MTAPRALSLTSLTMGVTRPETAPVTGATACSTPSTTGLRADSTPSTTGATGAVTPSAMPLTSRFWTSARVDPTLEVTSPATGTSPTTGRPWRLPMDASMEAPRASTLASMFLTSSTVEVTLEVAPLTRSPATGSSWRLPTSTSTTSSRASTLASAPTFLTSLTVEVTPEVAPPTMGLTSGTWRLVMWAPTLALIFLGSTEASTEPNLVPTFALTRRPMEALILGLATPSTFC